MITAVGDSPVIFMKECDMYTWARLKYAFRYGAQTHTM